MNTELLVSSVCKEFSYEELKASLVPRNLIGSGAFGRVFRGRLRDGTDVALKVIANPKESGFREEVEVNGEVLELVPFPFFS